MIVHADAARSLGFLSWTATNTALILRRDPGLLSPGEPRRACPGLDPEMAASAVLATGLDESDSHVAAIARR